MFIINIKGGLGNQLFQYALAYSLSKRFPEQNIYLDYKYFSKSHKLKEGLSKFDLGLNDLNVIDLPQTSILQRFYGFYCRKFGLHIKETTDLTYKPEILKGRYNSLDGYWQNQAYFEEFAEEIRNMFVPKKYLIESCNEHFSIVRQSNTVSVHIRRGDYLNVGFQMKNQMKYYQQAMEHISKEIENPIWIFFSDDMAWVKENFAHTSNTYFINTGNQVIDLHLMSNCTHHIIANSTFSWWGAWLGTELNSINIAPKDWISGLIVDLIPPNWWRI